MRKQAKEVTPMDDGIREEAVGTAATNRQRQCWAIKTLVAEVDHMFPETPVTYGDYDGRNTAMSVEFDFMGLDDDDTRSYVVDLFTMLGDSAHNEDARIARVEVVGWEVKVTMKTHPILMDTRDTFGLPEAWGVLFEPEDEDEGEVGVFGSPDIHEALTGTAWPHDTDGSI